MGFFYWLLMMVIFAFFGVLVHLFRGTLNFFPDKYDITPGRPLLNFELNQPMTDNYSFWDYLVGTDYDEDGYYELGSMRNLRNMMLWTVFAGLFMFGSADPLCKLFVVVVDATPGFLWHLFLYRLQNLKFA